MYKIILISILAHSLFLFYSYYYYGNTKPSQNEEMGDEEFANMLRKRYFIGEQFISTAVNLHKLGIRVYMSGFKLRNPTIWNHYIKNPDDNILENLESDKYTS